MISTLATSVVIKERDSKLRLQSAENFRNRNSQEKYMLVIKFYNC